MKNSGLPLYMDTVSIIPGGTVQFLDLSLDLRIVKRLHTEYLEYSHENASPDIGAFRIACLRQTDDGSGYVDAITGDEWIDPNTSKKIPNIEPSYSISKEKALEPFINQWFPIPYFRSSGAINRTENRYRYGPTDWARAYITPVENPDNIGYTHSITIAFDTHIEEGIDVPNVPSAEGYAGVAAMDVIEGAEYHFVSEFKNLVWFLKLDWVNDWLSEFYEEFMLSKKHGKSNNSDVDNKFEHISRYLSLLELISISSNLPKVRLVDPARNHSCIDVDLVLDIGNSRTIGMLIEKREDSHLSLENGSILELRDLTSPQKVYRNTFSSYVCFSKGKFGDRSGFSRGAGRSRSSFMWPSCVRVGEEALKLSVLSRKEQGQTSSSSPKRYLWDMKPAKQEWRFAPDPNDPGAEESPVNTGDFAGYINNFGFPLESKRNWLGAPTAQPEFPVTEPFFCRSSLMMFLLSEIISHALVQINSPAQRLDRGLPDIPRRLRRIIMTAPPAMSVSERKIYENWANSAIDVLWKSMEWNFDGKDLREYRNPPSIRMNLDEASATQLVFVYNEIERKFTGDATKYFDLFGQNRKNYPGSPSLRVASIDIGGGTTDMVITTYVNERISTTNRLIPHQEFREGFNFAGDDLVKIIIEKHILPNLSKHLSSIVRGPIQELMHRKFAQEVTGISESDKSHRAQFTKQVLFPIALKILTHLEELRNEESHVFSLSMPLTDYFENHDLPTSEVLNYVQNVQTINRLPIELINWNPTFELGEIVSTLSEALSPYMEDLCEIIQKWNCDFLVLSGRPSCLPLIHSLINRMTPVLPSRIVPMSKYKVENWYPFWTTPDGRIADPKTTGVVGALLSAVSEGYLKNFTFQSSALKPASTIRFIGPMENDKKILNENLLFSGNDVAELQEEEVSTILRFQTRMHIGFRQMPTERWKTTPFYFLSFSTNRAAERADKGGPYELHLSYIRRFDDNNSANNRSENEGILKITQILDKDGSSVPLSTIEIQLKTLWDDSHWLDSGLFDIH